MRFRIALAVLFVGLVATWVSRERPVTTASFDAPIALAASPAQQVAALKATPTPRIPAFRAMPDGSFTPVQPSIKEEDRWKNPAKPVEPAFPARFSEAVRVRSGVADIRATPVGGNPASTPRVTDDGSLVYADAFPGCDVKYRCEPLKTEEFIVVKDAAAQTAWSWDLETNGLTPRYTPMDTVELIDGNGVPRLRIDAPFGADAKGKKLRVGEALAFKVAGRRLTLTADLKGCAFPVEIDPSFASTGSMSVARIGHTTVLLPDGRVLVACGSNTVQGLLKTSEYFDPAAGVWSAGPDLSVPREGHVSYLLSNGKVLVAGGANGSGPLNTSELLDLTANAWSAGGDLVEARNIPTGVKLADGRILLTGGSANGNPRLSTTEFYSPGTNSWTAGPSFVASTGGRQFHTATQLLDGRVLVSGGQGLDNSVFVFHLQGEILSADGLSWTATTPANITRFNSQAALMPDGRVAFFSGNSTLMTSTKTCEYYDPGTGNYTLSVDLDQFYLGHTATRLPDGRVFLFGSFNAEGYQFFSQGPDAASGTVLTGSARRMGHTATLLADNNRVLITGGFDGQGAPYYSSCAIYTVNLPPVVVDQALTTPNPAAVAITLSATDGDNGSITLSVAANPTHGTLTGTIPNLVYTPDPLFIGTDSFTFQANDGTSARTATVTITVTPSPPAISSGPLATPNPSAPGENVQFSVAATDAQALSYAWNFGDGSTGTGASPSHVYAAVGEYSAVVTVTDAAGTATTGSVLVKVSSKPTARFTTTDIVAFEGVPFGFDATFSTDPENAIVAYAWDFGDGSPTGAGEEISKIYAQAGTYTTTLTVTDAAGQTATASRVIEVLDQSQVGLFNSEVAYNVKWDRQKTNADTLTFSATVNVGDTTVGLGTNVALEIAGSSFAGTLDKRLTDKRNKNAVWSVKAGTKKQGVGEVALTVKIKKANLGLGFNLAGAVAGNNPKETVKLEIPVRLEVAGRVFELMVDSEFKFSKGGTSAKGSGEGP